METRAVNRLTELAAVACIVAAVWLLVLPLGGSDASGDLAGMKAQEIQGAEGEAFRSLLDEARRLVDGGGKARDRLTDLVSTYPGRHEVWALSARYHEAVKVEPAALMDYARAVRLEPDYLDDGSPLYLGARIEGVTKRELARLRAKKSAEGLSGEEGEMIKAAYFLVRRLAGGCE
jgi:hypothetical protein